MATTEADHPAAAVDERDVRALQQFLTVLPDVDRAAGAAGLYEVVSESGSQYLVDAREGVCECPDFEYRALGPKGCKHLRRVAFATGRRPIPPAIDRDDVDPQLGQHVDARPRWAATDGGMVEAGDEGATPEADGRPAECNCVNPAADLPCWPCWNAGFETPNPEA